MTYFCSKNNVDIEYGYAKIKSVWTRVEMSPSRCWEIPYRVVSVVLFWLNVCPPRIFMKAFYKKAFLIIRIFLHDMI